jgi:hypothetical protein
LEAFEDILEALLDVWQPFQDLWQALPDNSVLEGNRLRETVCAEMPIYPLKARTP